jgi:hypothetical protein
MSHFSLFEYLANKMGERFIYNFLSYNNENYDALICGKVIENIKFQGPAIALKKQRLIFLQNLNMLLEFPVEKSMC